MGVPDDRLTVAVGLLDLRPEDRVLEIGCGRGAASELILERLPRGDLLGLDRSDVAVVAAAERNAEAVAQGRAAFLRSELADANPDVLGRYDKVFALDVNVFWTGPAAAELAVVTRLLSPSGSLVLCYAPPDPDPAKIADLKERLLTHLSDAGFIATATIHALAGGSSLLAVVAAVARPAGAEGAERAEEGKPGDQGQPPPPS